MDFTDQFERAARLITSADGLIITAGAGMGVDSGLPDFRGNDGFWRAYPALANAGISFTSIANAPAFVRNPRQAWGFYGHRLHLYRNTVPHDGFAILCRIAERMPRGAFVFTSNVDGQFQKAGFSERRVCEVHGSIRHLQCVEPCCHDIWSADMLQPKTDDAICSWVGTLPMCIHCGRLARPNVLMFDDMQWFDERTNDQRARLRAWMNGTTTPVVIELGAGLDIPTVRTFGKVQGAPMIRINTLHAGLPEAAGVSLNEGALVALRKIDLALRHLEFFD